MTSVLVFDDESTPASLQESEPSVVVFDSSPGVEADTQPGPNDLILVDPVPTQTSVQIEGAGEVLVITPGGLPGPPGPPGPQGQPGTPGEGSYYQVFGFASPATVWTVVHNLLTYAVNVETVDSQGESIEGNVRYLDQNTIEIDWYYPTAGEARLFR